MRVLITGAGGQLGTDLVAAFAEHESHEVVGVAHAELDVADRDQVLQVAGSVRPDAIVHAAAWTAVDACEGDRDRAYAVNALGSRHIGEAAALVGAHVLAVSTDYVFDGSLDRAYTEWDEPNPQSVYGFSKLAGERELIATTPGAAIVRTAWVCSVHGSNMVKTVLRLATTTDKPLRFVNDQHGCPT